MTTPAAHPLVEWPDPPPVEKDDPQAAVKLARYQADLDVLKADYTAKLERLKAQANAVIEERKIEAAADFEREKADWLSEYAQTQAVNNAYLDVAKLALDRATAKATFVQGAATAISGAYAGVLGLSFALAQSKPLPGRGIVPGVFLGLAIALAAAYVAFVTKPEDVKVIPSNGTLTDNQRERRNSFILWARAPVLRRRNLLQASVVSLGIGVGLLPLPYLSIPTNYTVIVAILGVIGVIAVSALPHDDSR